MEFDQVNDNDPDRSKEFGNASRKIGADIYIDDLAMLPIPAELHLKLERMIATL